MGRRVIKPSGVLPEATLRFCLARLGAALVELEGEDRATALRDLDAVESHIQALQDLRGALDYHRHVMTTGGQN